MSPHSNAAPSRTMNTFSTLCQELCADIANRRPATVTVRRVLVTLLGTLWLSGCGALVADLPDSARDAGTKSGSDKTSNPTGGTHTGGGTLPTAGTGTGPLPSAGSTGIGGTTGTQTGGVNSTTTNSAADAGSVSDFFQLQGAPLLFNPTSHSFGLSVVLAKGDPSVPLARTREEGSMTWGSNQAPLVRGQDIAQWNFQGLNPGTRYEYQLLLPTNNGPFEWYSGHVVTQRPTGQAFNFALLSDSHIGSDGTFTNQGDWSTLTSVGQAIGEFDPDFMLNLGDMLDFHNVGFNAPPPDTSYPRQAYLNYRTLLGDSLSHASHFAAIGNWEGENGDYTAEEIDVSRSQRLLYVPLPDPKTYPESGSPAEDYYAFTWGDALFVVLNVMSYTPTSHLLDYYPGVPDDWTLGAAQFDWLTQTLTNATAKWRFLFIHHPVGGAAGNSTDAAYGRGGGQAAHVGEQAKVHQLMLDYGVQVFFYGHDHVFTDMTVDGIHYSEPGSAGAIWYFTSDETGYTQAWLVSGWSRVSVSTDSVHVQFIGMDGAVIYEYTLQ